MTSSNKRKKKNLERTKEKITKIVRILGPGFVTGSSDDDPSGIGTYSIAGAKYGLTLAWLIPFQLPLMFVVQEMCARIGIVTGESLTENMKKIFPRPLVFFAVFVLVCANILTIAANIAIMSESIKLLLDVNTTLLAIVVATFIIFTEIFVSYHVYSKFLMILALSLFAYVATAFVVSQDWVDVLRSAFVPQFQLNKDFALIAAGIIGTTISPYLFFWQTSQEVEESKERGIIGFSGHYRNHRLIEERKGTFVGMFFTQIIALFVMITCFSTLHKNGITEINTAYDAAMALKPFAGEWSSLIFTLGIIGAGFLAIPVLAGSAAYALAAFFERREGLLYNFMDAPFFNGVIILSTFLGLFINFVGIHPIKALLYAAVVNCIGAVPLIALILLLANNKRIMGKKRNGFFSNIIGGFTFLLMFLAAAIVLVFTFV